VVVEVADPGLARQGDPSPLRHQRRSAVAAFDGDLQPPAGTMVGLEYGTVAPVGLGDADAVLARQRLDQGALHDVLQPVEAVEVEGQLVVAGDAAELRLVLGDDGEVAVDRAFGPPDRPAVMQVGTALGADNVGTFNPICALMLR